MVAKAISSIFQRGYRGRWISPFRNSVEVVVEDGLIARRLPLGIFVLSTYYFINSRLLTSIPTLGVIIESVDEIYNTINNSLADLFLVFVLLLRVLSLLLRRECRSWLGYVG